MQKPCRTNVMRNYAFMRNCTCILYTSVNNSFVHIITYADSSHGRIGFSTVFVCVFWVFWTVAVSIISTAAFVLWTDSNINVVWHGRSASSTSNVDASSLSQRSLLLSVSTGSTPSSNILQQLRPAYVLINPLFQCTFVVIATTSFRFISKLDGKYSESLQITAKAFL